MTQSPLEPRPGFRVFSRSQLWRDPMPKRVRTGLTRSDILDRYVERFKQQLMKFQPFLSRKRGSASLEDFDEAAEELIGQVFGSASDEAEAYVYAKTGESASIPEEAQESGTHDIERESLHQRRQVLENCLSDLERRRRVQAARQGSEKKVLVSDYMSHDVRSIHRGATIKQAGQLLQKHKVGSLIVDDGSRYIGIITDSDLTRRAVAKGLDPNTTTVATCMSRSLVTIEEDESLADAMSLMKKQGIRHLPVTADATIIGVLSVSDLIRAFEEQKAP
jgi:CBS domain-containing protein